jgi:hypothetical protein
MAERKERGGRRKESDSWGWAPAFGGDATPPSFKGRCVVFWWPEKRGPYWGAAGARNLPHLPQYDRFMGIEGSIGELLEMLLLSDE